ncbi:MAG: serine/threonine protein kinase [Myxococcales bacterium]|nr:serine/threonine protein kinase [Myxococcales bacterium]
MTTRNESVNLGPVARRNVETRDYDVDEGPAGEPRRPSRLGRYVVLREIGRGGMGVVWTAYDPELDRRVAIKLLKGSARKGVRRARFIREAQALAKLTHPNIITVYDVGTHEGRLYMAMEYIEGLTLERWCAKPRSWREVLEVFDLAGQGLAAAHDAGFTHRDFKPSNVLIAEDGRVKVLDFGLAKHLSHTVRDSEDPGYGGDEEDSGEQRVALLESSPHAKLTQVGRLLGTPGYMAPEQFSTIDTREIGAFTDQFAFGVALYEALYGELPFAGADLYETYDNIRDGNMIEPRRDSAVPGWVLRVIQRALHYHPEQRYPSMNAMLAALRADPVRRRRRVLAYAGGIGVIGLAGMGIVGLVLDDEAPRPCQGAAEHLVGVWDAPARERVDQALRATGRPFSADTAQRVAASLDRYAGHWVDQHTAICEATRIHGEQSESLLDVRMTCLDRRRGELEALVEVLATAEEETVAAAVVAAAELRRPEACATAQPGVELELPTDPVRRDEFLRLRERVDEAQALLSAGRHIEARDLAAATGNGAADAGFRGLEAETLLIQGAAHRLLREPAVAQRRLREGIVAASEVGDARVEFMSWNSLLYVAGVMAGEPQQAADWQFAAENALRHAGSPPDLEFRLALTTSAVMAELHRLDEAARYGEQARRIALESTEPGSLSLAQALNNLGIVAAKQADWPLAERRLRDSYELKKAIFGPKHPEVASNGMNLANVLTQQAGQGKGSAAAYDEAERIFTDVVAFREDSEGPGSAGVARTLVMLGLLQINRGKLAEARATHERALSLLRALPHVEDDLAGALSNLGKIDRLEDRYSESEAHYREALELQRRRLGDAHPMVGTTRLQLCRLLQDADRLRDALAECKLALTILEAGAQGRALPSLVSAHTLIAELAEALGREHEAAEHRAHARALGGDPEPAPG